MKGEEKLLPTCVHGHVAKSTEQICQALVSIAFYEQDWPWVQEQCLVLLSNKASAIRGLAATCLGHIARMHGQ